MDESEWTRVSGLVPAEDNRPSTAVPVRTKRRGMSQRGINPRAAYFESTPNAAPSAPG